MLFLVVDDDALSRDLLRVLLEAENYQVELASSGEAAVARVASCVRSGPTHPDVVLTDIQMPGLSGNSLAAALKPLLLPETLLLAMSGSKPAVSALSGFDGFLLKPFTISSLISMISRAESREPGTSAQAFGLHEPKTAPGEGYCVPALDEEIYSKMCDLMPAAQLGEMYALCVDDARKRIGRMKSLADESNDEQYRSEAHAVKGGCGMIGASELYELAAAAERQGLDPIGLPSGTSTVTEMLTQLSLACHRLERILQERAQE